MSSELEDALYALEVIYHDVSDSAETKCCYEGLQLTIRQLAESRAELLKALGDVLDGLGVLGGGAHELCGHGIAEDRAEEIKRIYLTNATQQRKEPGA